MSFTYRYITVDRHVYASINEVETKVSIAILDENITMNSDTYWKNYRMAMQWIQGNDQCRSNDISIETITDNEPVDNEKLQFTIDDDLLNFYRLSRDHRANRSM
jgi:hypothetical protein